MLNLIPKTKGVRFKFKKVSVLLVCVFILSIFLVPSISHAVPCERIEEGIRVPPGCDLGGLVLELNRPLESTIGSFLPEAEAVAAAISTILMNLTGILLAIAGGLLNIVLVFTVQQMSTLIENAKGIKVAWEVIRDIANIGFIFTIVYIAISTILGLTGKGIKELLGKLILAALLVNFSFFFTGVLIDVSNVTTLVLYNRVLEGGHIGSGDLLDLQDSIQSQAPNQVGTPNPNEIDLFNVGISGIFMKSLGMSGVFSVPDLENGGLSASKILLTGIFSSVLFFILTFIFLSISVLLIVRLVAFIILITLSPVAYLGWAFPGMKKHSDQWWGTFWDQALFAPIYMLMTLVVVVIINNPSFQNAVLGPFSGSGATNLEANGFATLLSGQGGVTANISLLINYMIVIGLAIASVVIAKTTSTKSGGAIAGWGGKLTGYVDNLKSKTIGGAKASGKFAGGVALGAGAYVGGRTLGRVAGGLRQYAGQIGEDVQKEKPETEIGKFLAGRDYESRAGRAFGAVTRTASQVVGAKAGKAARERIEKLKDKYKGLSNEALKNKAAAITTTEEEQAAIIDILQGKKDLKPQGSFTAKKIRRGVKTIRNAGLKTKDAEGSLLWQYAEDGHKLPVDKNGKPATDPEKIAKNDDGSDKTKSEKIVAIENIGAKNIEDLKENFFTPMSKLMENLNKKATEEGWSDGKKAGEIKAIKTRREEGNDEMSTAYRKWNSGHLNKMWERDDDMAKNFLTELKNDSGADTRDKLAEWLRKNHGEDNRLANYFGSKKPSASLVNMLTMMGIDPQMGGEDKDKDAVPPPYGPDNRRIN